MILRKSSYEKYLPRIGFVLLFSEIWKQITLTLAAGSFNVWYFPFQLCSLPLYLCTLYPIFPKSLKVCTQAFLMTFSLLGGAAAFLDTTGMHYEVETLTIHSFCWHVGLVGLGIWSGLVWCRQSLSQENESVPQSTMFNHREKHAGNASPQKEKMRHAGRNPVYAALPIWGICLLIATILNLVYLLAMFCGAWMLGKTWSCVFINI